MWESGHPGREGPRMMEGEAFYRTQPPPPPPPVASHGPAPPQMIHGQNAAEPEVPRGATGEAKHPGPPPPSNPAKPPADMNSGPPKVRQSKAGGSGDTNPLILRRRVRSFISPIPAKRQLQDVTQQRAATNSHHSPGAHSESSHHNEEDSTSSDILCPRLSSPMSGENSYSQPQSPSSANTKALPPKKGRGLKLEAIVQKITPNIKKPGGHAEDESNHYPGFSHSDAFNDSQDQDLTAQALKQQDFDFGLGSSVASASDDKEDFALLGPLPPPPPLPRPVQGSPPPSSSALSDIQHFTNTYQELETRRGEQSAADLLRQKLQESGMGFDDYPGSDYYGTTPPHHSQGQGHMLSRHQMSSGRSSLSPDSKNSDSLVPKGYFPSGKKKGRPCAASAPQTDLSPSSTPAPAEHLLSDDKITPPLDPPVLTQVVKVDVESEDTQPEAEVKPVRRRRQGVKDEDGPLEARGRQRRRRRGGAATAPSVAKDDPDTPSGAGGGRAFTDSNRKGPFAPHIHVENKVPEIGAVCTIVNSEEEKMKAKAGGSGLESLLTSALSSQAPVMTETDHSGRLLCCLCQKWANYKHLGDLYGPFYRAEYAAKLPKNQPQVRQGQATTGTNKTGANPDMSSNYLSTIQDSQTPEAQFPKPVTESDYTISLDSNPASLSTPVRTASPAGREDMMMHVAGKLSNAASSYSCSSSSSSSYSSATTTTTTSKTKFLTWDMNPDTRPIPQLKRELDLETDPQQVQKQLQPPPDEALQRPQHRKLTSHPRFKRRHKSSEDSPRMVPSNSKASLPFQPPPPALDSLGPLAQLAQLPQMPLDPEELWVHECCIVWTSGVYLVNGRLYGLQEALDGARETSCSYCEMVGSTLGCHSKGCTLRYHYMCAIEADCSLNEDNYSLRCPKHKVKKESLHRASGPPSQFTWSSQREAERDGEEEETQESGSC
ncbi:unnamed protein product [Pleuronectes platessa]|uniref:PHD-type domain-containing protein n=1 Tax=Pleuronectes platessa TaxID=8262 RepID=A0A9N7UKQ8_PLEPL|nr:unnamed protein product [Pleuronectes platessa]